MIHRAIARVLLTAMLMSGSTLCAQAPSSDVAVSVFPFLVGNMDSRVSEIANNCQLHGIDTVYISAYRASGPSTGQLWITDSAGTWNPAFGAVRPGGAGINLVSLIAACHAVNVRVVAVLKCFDASVQPDNAAHRQYLLDVVSYLVDSFEPSGLPTYDIDGIALDYVRYVGGGSVNPQLVTNFVSDVRDRIGPLSLHAYVLANRYTFDGPVYNGQFSSYNAVISSLSSQYGQHWEQLAPYVDVFMPMTYTANGSIYSTYALHQAYVRQAALYARTACQNAGYPTRRVCCVVKTYTSTGETTTTQTIDASITGSLLGGGDGYQSFRYQFLVANPSWWNPMAQHAVAGCNWPVPRLGVSAQGLTVTADPATSRDSDQPSNTLRARIDFDGDGQFDTPWGGNVASADLARHPGPWKMALQVRDTQGHVSTTRRSKALASGLALSHPFLPATAGGNLAVNLDVGPAASGHIYLTLASLSGAAPGFVFAPGFPVPLNIDFLTSSMVGNPNGGLISSGLGMFDGNGRATTTLTLPPGVASPFAWTNVHWSFVAMDLAGQPSCVGGSASIVILP